MVPNIVHGAHPMTKLYQQAVKNVGFIGKGNALDPYQDNNYLRYKRKVHEEFYRLIAAAGIQIEGA